MNRQGFDAAYIERLGRGDSTTEANFFAYFGELILIKARARRLPKPLADEVLQETLLRVLRTLRSPGDGLRRPESLGAFVNGVCNNVLRERYRDQKRHQTPAEEPAPIPDTRTPSPEAQLMTKERQRVVREVMERMSPDKSRLLREVLLEEDERGEICRRHDVSPDYLRVLLHRAKQEFRELYAEREGRSPATAGNPRAAREAEADRSTVRAVGIDGRRASSTLGL